MVLQYAAGEPPDLFTREFGTGILPAQQPGNGREAQNRFHIARRLDARIENIHAHGRDQTEQQCGSERQTEQLAGGRLWWPDRADAPTKKCAQSLARFSSSERKSMRS